jgi:hypothetical protein
MTRRGGGGQIGWTQPVAWRDEISVEPLRPEN